MHLGVIADDFTGASDIANTLARGGLASFRQRNRPSLTVSETRLSDSREGSNWVDEEATPVFAEFPIEIAGKTGTAERGIGHANQSWFISLAPYPNPNIVTVVTMSSSMAMMPGTMYTAVDSVGL